MLEAGVLLLLLRELNVGAGESPSSESTSYASNELARPGWRPLRSSGLSGPARDQPQRHSTGECGREIGQYRGYLFISFLFFGACRVWIKRVVTLLTKLFSITQST